MSTVLHSYSESHHQIKGRTKCWDNKFNQLSQRLETFLRHLCPDTSIFQSVQFGCHNFIPIYPLQTLEMLPLINSLHSEIWVMPSELITQVYGFKHFLDANDENSKGVPAPNLQRLQASPSTVLLWGMRGGCAGFKITRWHRTLSRWNFHGQLEDSCS